MNSLPERPNPGSSSRLPLPLRGVIPPMVTPLLDPDTLDAAGLERLVAHILAGGVHGLFLLGTTGEGPSLSYRLRAELIERTCRLVNGRVPVLVGISDTALVESVRLADVAARAGAAAVVVAPPYYFVPSQAELLGYLERLVRQVSVPLFLYNQPSHTKVPLEIETVRCAAQLPGVVGVKDSSANMIYFHRLVGLFQDRPDFTLLVGPEELLAESILLGGHGGVNGGANLHPRLYVELYEAARARALGRVAALHRQVLQISAGIYSVGGSSVGVIKGLKCALSILGICSDCPAEPFQRLGPSERACIERQLRDLGLLDTKAP
jgi:dihydrodipicolinate synthase/N-acetylneuraminate lyase